MKLKIFADGANYKDIIRLSGKTYIKGLTTNPTLMRQSGIKNYVTFSKKVLKKVKKIPISLEVFADDLNEMYVQAKKINSWGKNVYVKVPIVNTKGQSTKAIIKKLLEENVKLNVTAIMKYEQILKLKSLFKKNTKMILSIFAGRIADTGVDPVNDIKRSLKLVKNFKKIEILWASPREVLNIYQAENIGCHIITVTPALIKKFFLLKKYNLNKYSIETSKMFYDDAKKSNFKI
jgi:transaldolase